MIFTLFWLTALTFSIWMLIDCLSNKVKDKIFWSIIILLIAPIGAIIYAIKRPTLIGETNLNNGTLVSNNNGSKMSSSSQVVRGLGMALGVILAVGGLLIVGYFILIIVLIVSFGNALGSSGSSK